MLSIVLFSKLGSILCMLHLIFKLLKLNIEASRQWPEVYDLCQTFLHVELVKKPMAMLECRNMPQKMIPLATARGQTISNKLLDSKTLIKAYYFIGHRLEEKYFGLAHFWCDVGQQRGLWPTCLQKFFVLATVLAAMCGCNLFRILPDIVYKLLLGAIWSGCAVSEQMPFIKAHPFLCAALHTVHRNLSRKC